MKTYEIYTKYANGAYTIEPIHVKTFTDVWDAYEYIKGFADTQGAKAKTFLSQSHMKFLLGKANSFGVGAKMFCEVRGN